MTMQAGGFEFLRSAQTGASPSRSEVTGATRPVHDLAGILSGGKGGDSFAVALTDEIVRKDIAGQAAPMQPDQLVIKDGDLPEEFFQLLSLADRIASRTERPPTTASPDEGKKAGDAGPVGDGTGLPENMTGPQGEETPVFPTEGKEGLPSSKAETSNGTLTEGLPPTGSLPAGSAERAGSSERSGSGTTAFRNPPVVDTREVRGEVAAAPRTRNFAVASREAVQGHQSTGAGASLKQHVVEGRHPQTPGSRLVGLPEEGRAGRPEPPESRQPVPAGRGEIPAPIGRADTPAQTGGPIGRPVSIPVPTGQAVEAGERPVQLQERPVQPQGHPPPAPEASSRNADQHPLRNPGATRLEAGEEVAKRFQGSESVRPSTTARALDHSDREIRFGRRPDGESKEARAERVPPAPSGKNMSGEPSRPVSSPEKFRSSRPEATVNPREQIPVNSVSAERPGGDNRPAIAFDDAGELPGKAGREPRTPTVTPSLREMPAQPVPPPTQNTAPQTGPVSPESARANGEGAMGNPGGGGDSSSSGRGKREQRSPQLERAEKPAQAPSPESPSSSGKAPAAAHRVGYVSEIFSRSLESIERLLEQQSGNRIQLNFKTESGDDMKVLIKYSNGLLHSTFVTDSDSLRMALREGWMQFQRQLAERGVEANQPDFRHHSGDSQSGQRGDDGSPAREDSFGNSSFAAKRGSAGRGQASTPPPAAPPPASSGGPYLNTYA